MVQLHWACSSAEICDVSIEDTCVLAQVGSTLAPKLTCSVYCIEVLCDGRVLQAQDSWRDLGEPASFDIVLLSPTHDYSSELLAAVREGDDDGVHEIVRRRQSLQIFWNEENDNLLILYLSFPVFRTSSLHPHCQWSLSEHSLSRVFCLALLHPSGLGRGGEGDGGKGREPTQHRPYRQDVLAPCWLVPACRLRAMVVV